MGAVHVGAKREKAAVGAAFMLPAFGFSHGARIRQARSIKAAPTAGFLLLAKAAEFVSDSGGLDCISSHRATPLKPALAFPPSLLVLFLTNRKQILVELFWR